MSTLQQLQDRRALAFASYSKALKSQEYQVGSGGTARRHRMADFEQIRLELDSLDKQIANHPDTLAAQPLAARRRVLYARPFR